MANIIPNAARDYLENAGLNGGAQYSNWYIGLYEADRAPTANDTMATFLADCQESTAYTTTGNNRIPLTPGALENGVWSNVANKAEFPFTANKTIYGAFITSNPTRGSNTGLLLAAGKFPTARNPQTDEILRVVAGVSMTTL